MRYTKDIAPTFAHLEQVHRKMNQLVQTFVTMRPLTPTERRRVSVLAEEIGRNAGVLDLWARCERRP